MRTVLGALPAGFDQGSRIEILAFDGSGENVCVWLDQSGPRGVLCECQRDCP